MGRELGKSLFDPQLRLVWRRRGGQGEREGGKRPESNFLSLLLPLAERDQANFLAEAAWDELGKQERRRMETFFPSSLLSRSLCFCFYLLQLAFGSIPNQGEEGRSNLTGVGSKEETGHEEEGLRALMGKRTIGIAPKKGLFFPSFSFLACL